MLTSRHSDKNTEIVGGNALLSNLLLQFQKTVSQNSKWHISDTILRSGKFKIIKLPTATSEF